MASPRPHRGEAASIAVLRLREWGLARQAVDLEAPGVIAAARAVGLTWDQVSQETGVNRETLRRRYGG